jgi:glycogen debranching enzyme
MEAAGDHEEGRATTHELRDNARRAISWAETNMERSLEGFVSYHARSAHGLDNQGWKDSDDAIVDADGSLAEPPIALAEVQGYAYLAFREIAALFARDGDHDTAARLLARADDLRDRYNRRFWLDEAGTYALALQKSYRPAAVVASNAGQALWSGIAPDDRARRTAARLMREDMFAGWGIRTLSASERRYNPIGYHVGSIWPHDNAIIAAGFRRYGIDDPAKRIFAGILALAAEFPLRRLPELITGFSRDEMARPVRYPVACHPQAWAAGSVPFLLTTLLGLAPEGFEGRLRVVRPLLPDSVSRLSLTDLRVGRGAVSLRFARAEDGSTQLEVLAASEGIRVELEP